jgi:DNA recombination protein RmuC
LISNIEKEIRTQVEQKFTQQSQSIKDEFRSFSNFLNTKFTDITQLQKDRYDEIEKRQNELIKSTDKHLTEMKETVEEKLQKTLNERISQSFQLVTTQLESVQKGLGDMQTLAQDVGGLKKVLSNVKMRGGFGEVQLSLLLEQILAPEQYEANVKTKKGSNDLVEFAVKLPGKDEEGSVVYLPIDAKFPKDAYEFLQEAYETGDPDKFQVAQKNLETTIKKMAKDIRDKYIDPPNTTDFGIMFLPFEGIYAEVVKKASLLEELQRDYKVIVTGPTTLAAILNSLQMGFRTLTIQKRSSEVWKVLGAVKKEFENFGGLIGKAQNNIQTGLNQLDEVLGVRTRAINSKLKNIQALETNESVNLLDIDTNNDE